jgi:glyceraldehyde 3-phosphate dehydrogenase
MLSNRNIMDWRAGMCNRLIFIIGDNRSMRNVEYDKIYGIIVPFMNVDYMVYQLKYDSVHKRYPGTVCSKEDGDDVHLVVNEVEIQVFKSKEPRIV